TEIMYHAPDITDPVPLSGDDLDFLEFKNTGSTTQDLSGLSFTSGITFTFPFGTLLAPNAFFVLGRNAAALQAKYPGLVVHGVFASGRLDNGGEPLQLSYSGGIPLISLTYDDIAPWPVPADGYGFSLVPRETSESNEPNAPWNWRASTNPGGSPGADEPLSLIPPILVNEVLSAS